MSAASGSSTLCGGLSGADGGWNSSIGTQKAFPDEHKRKWTDRNRSAAYSLRIPDFQRISCQMSARKADIRLLRSCPFPFVFTRTPSVSRRKNFIPSPSAPGRPPHTGWMGRKRRTLERVGTFRKVNGRGIGSMEKMIDNLWKNVGFICRMDRDKIIDKFIFNEQRRRTY